MLVGIDKDYVEGPLEAVAQTSASVTGSGGSPSSGSGGSAGFTIGSASGGSGGHAPTSSGSAGTAASGGAGGAAGSGATGGGAGTGGGDPCDKSGSCVTCQGCVFAADGPCHNEVEVCKANSECVALNNCLTECANGMGGAAGAGQCNSDCNTAHAGGNPDYALVVTCVSTHCVSDCNF
jgi:hypothetical protein